MISLAESEMYAYSYYNRTDASLYFLMGEE